MDNNTIAILTKVNELIERYGITPCDVVIAISDAPGGLSRLTIEMPPEDENARRRFEHAMRAIGLSLHTPSRIGSDQELYSLLQDALRHAPRQRPRG